MLNQTATTKKIARVCAFCACALVVVWGGASAAGAAQREQTRPVLVRSAKPVPVRVAPAAQPKAAAKNTSKDVKQGKAEPVKKSGNIATRKGSKGFTGNPLALERRPATDGQKRAKVVYGAEGQRREQSLTLGEDRVSMSATRRKIPESRLTPARTPFSGGENTLPYMESDPPPEVSMQYKLRNNATTRLTVNPQDLASPLYRPVENDGRITAAGVYMDVEVKPDVRLQVGGEYHDVEARDASAGASQGAAVGLQWRF
ncbi:MAG: hypothetical protein FWG04_05665 [Desulfovibrionaceae bacterium]|nr:hypothetical protein [Desulfovibrionaceae bacterium]